MKKILIINTVGYNYDGITSVILNYLQHMDRNGLDFTFPIFEETPSALKTTLEQLGSVVTVPNRKQNVKGYIFAIHSVLQNSYDCIHIHGNSGTMLIEAILAKLHGVKRILPHAHATTTNHPFVNKILKQPMLLLSSECLACSTASGKWLYGRKKHTVLRNAFDIAKYQYDPQKRVQYRQEFGIAPTDFLIGHVGHFSPTKNHTFLLAVFKTYLSINDNAKLLLISDGACFEQIKAQVSQDNLSDRVIFAGRRSDTAQIYSAMDLFILPSLSEGLSLVTLEAQANGLPSLVSSAVPTETQCTDRVFYKSLSDSVQQWAAAIEEIRMHPFDRTSNTGSAIAMHGYDICREAGSLRKIYLE